MKFLSLLLIVVAMSWTWSLVQEGDTPSVPQRVHTGIQEDLKSLIRGYISENLPDARDLQFKRFWTEPLGENKVKAQFRYSFVDTSVALSQSEVEIGGYAILNKSKKENSQTQEFWDLDELYILNNQIEFQQPMNVSPQENDAQ